MACRFQAVANRGSVRTDRFAEPFAADDPGLIGLDEIGADKQPGLRLRLGKRLRRRFGIETRRIFDGAGPDISLQEIDDRAIGEPVGGKDFHAARSSSSRATLLAQAAVSPTNSSAGPRKPKRSTVFGRSFKTPVATLCSGKVPFSTTA